MTQQQDPNRRRWNDTRQNTWGLASLILGVAVVVLLGFLIFGTGDDPDVGTTNRDAGPQTQAPNQTTPAPNQPAK